MRVVYRAPDDESPSNSAWLEDGSEYVVVGVESNPDRGIEFHLDLGDSLGWFDAFTFQISDGEIPSGWCVRVTGDVLVAEPVEFLRDDFWERFYDDGQEERDTVKRVLDELRRSHH